VIYSETSKGISASFLESRFFHSPFLGADVDVGPDEPLVGMAIDGTPWLCTLRTIGRNNHAFICFGDMNQDGAVEQWRRLTADPRRGRFVSSDRLSPLNPEPMSPIKTRKGRAEPLMGSETIVEVVYAGLRDGAAVFRSIARRTNEQTAFKEVETVAPLSSGAGTAQIKHPIGDRVVLDAMTELFLGADKDPTMLKALEKSGSVKRTTEVALLDVSKATSEAVTVTLRRPFLDWRHWSTNDDNGKPVEHTLWGKTQDELEHLRVLEELQRRAKSAQ
jgi:hypothetical protein